MFGMGWQEIMLIVVVGVLVVGPDQLPGVARTIGKLVAQFKRATNDLRNAVSEEIEQQEEFKEFKEFANDLETEVYDIQDTAKDYVDKEIKKGEKELDEIEADVSEAVDPDGVIPGSPGDSMPTGEYGPTIDIADGDVMGGGNSASEGSASEESAKGSDDAAAGSDDAAAGSDDAAAGSDDSAVAGEEASSAGDTADGTVAGDGGSTTGGDEAAAGSDVAAAGSEESTVESKVDQEGPSETGTPQKESA